MPPKPAAAEPPTPRDEGEEAPPPDLSELFDNLSSTSGDAQKAGLEALIALPQDDAHAAVLLAPYEGKLHKEWAERYAARDPDDDGDPEKEDPEPPLLCPAGAPPFLPALVVSTSPSVRVLACRAAARLAGWRGGVRTRMCDPDVLAALWEAATGLPAAPAESEEEVALEYAAWVTKPEGDDEDAKPLPQAAADACAEAALRAFGTLAFASAKVSEWLEVVEAPQRTIEKGENANYLGDGLAQSQARSRGKLPLLACLRKERAERVRAKAARCVTALSRSFALRSQMTSAGALAMLLDGIRKPPPEPEEGAEEAEKPADDKEEGEAAAADADGAAPAEPEKPPPFEPEGGPELLEHTATAVGRLLQDATWVQKHAVLDHDVVEALPALLSHEVASVQEAAAQALTATLRISTDAAAKLHAAAGVPLLAALLPTPPGLAPEQGISSDDEEDTTADDYLSAAFKSEEQLRLEQEERAAERARRAADLAARRAERALLFETSLPMPAGPAGSQRLQVAVLKCLTGLFNDDTVRAKVLARTSLLHVLLYMLTPPPKEPAEEEPAEEEPAEEADAKGDALKPEAQIEAEREAAAEAARAAAEAFAAARDALSSVGAGGLRELRSYHHPPKSTAAVLGAVLIVLGESRADSSDWNKARRKIAPQLVTRMKVIDARREAAAETEAAAVTPPRKVWRQAEKALKGLTEELVKKESEATLALYLWVLRGSALAKACKEAEKHGAPEPDLAAAPEPEPEPEAGAEGGDGKDAKAAPAEEAEVTDPALLPPFPVEVRAAAAAAVQAAALEATVQDRIADNANGEMSLLLGLLTADVPPEVADPVALLLSVLIPRTPADALESSGVKETLKRLSGTASNESMRTSVARALICFERADLLPPCKDVPDLPPPPPPPLPLPTDRFMFDALQSWSSVGVPNAPVEATAVVEVAE